MPHAPEFRAVGARGKNMTEEFSVLRSRLRLQSAARGARQKKTARAQRARALPRFEGAFMSAGQAVRKAESPCVLFMNTGKVVIFRANWGLFFVAAL